MRNAQSKKSKKQVIVFSVVLVGTTKTNVHFLWALNTFMIKGHFYDKSIFMIKGQK